MCDKLSKIDWSHQQKKIPQLAFCFSLLVFCFQFFVCVNLIELVDF